MKLELLEKKFHKNPQTSYFFPLANAYREHDRLDECIEVFRQGLSVFPHYWAAKVAFGRALFEKGDFDGALKELEDASDHVPENILLHELLASIYLKKGDISKAIHHCELVLFINPRHTEALGIKEKVLKIQGMDSQKESLHEQGKELLLKEKERRSLPEKKEEKEIEKEVGIEIEPVEEEQGEKKEEEERKQKTQKEDEEGEGGEEKERESFPIKEGEEIVTATLAELYVSQGLPEKAVEIYQKLIKQQPEQEEEWKRRIAAFQVCEGSAISQDTAFQEAQDEAVSPEISPPGGPKKKDPNELILQQLETWLKNIEKYEKAK